MKVAQNNKKHLNSWVFLLLAIILLIFILVGFFLASNYLVTYTPGKILTEIPTKSDEEEIPKVDTVRIAFIADQGITENSEKVLNLIKSEKADLILHQGDLDYESNPTAWINMQNKILGEDFPIYVAIGNHDEEAWKGYQEILTNRHQSQDKIKCTGDLGVKSHCRVSNIDFVQLGIGVIKTNYTGFVTESFKEAGENWKICSWHKNQNRMQSGSKTDEVGWEVYEECRENAAIVATGHEHAYSRTYLLSNMREQTLAENHTKLTLTKGKTFAFVSGISGKSVRPQNIYVQNQNWWAKIYTTTQNATYGALFCDFNYEQNPKKAMCYLKNINSEIIDEFLIEKE